MIPHRGGVTDLLVAAGELEVRQADGARFASELPLPQRPAVQGDRAGLFASRRGDPAVQPPEVCGERGRDGLPERIRGTAQNRTGLSDVVLEEPGLRQRAADRQLVFAGDGGRSERLGEILRGLGRVSTLQRGLDADHHGLQSHADHERSIHGATGRAVLLPRLG